jgi:hypothetical protein
MSRYAAVRRVFEEHAPPSASPEARAAGAQAFARRFRADLGLDVSPMGRPILDPAKRKMNANEWSLRGLAESLVGPEWVEGLERGAHGGQMVFEAGGVASMVPGQFPNVSAYLGSVTGLLDAAVLEGYQRPGYIIDELVETLPSKTRQRKMIGTGRIGNQSQRRNPGDPYPMAQFGERYQVTPETNQDALALSITFEAVAFDQTQEILEQADKLGDELALKKELDGFTVIAGVTNPYNYKGTAYNTYLTAGNWINDGSNVLVDYANFSVVDGLFSRMTDQETGLRINVEYDTVLVAPTKIQAAKAVLNATMVRTGSDTGGTNYTQTYAPGSRVEKQPTIKSSRYLDMLLTNATDDPVAPGLGLSQANADKYWWALKTGKGGAFYRTENWPLQVQQAAPNDFTMLNHKLLLAVFADQMHSFGVRDPRYVVRNKN